MVVIFLFPSQSLSQCYGGQPGTNGIPGMHGMPGSPGAPGRDGRRLPLIQFDRDLYVTRRFMFLFIWGILHRLWKTIFDLDRLQSREGEN